MEFWLTAGSRGIIGLGQNLQHGVSDAPPMRTISWLRGNSRSLATVFRFQFGLAFIGRIVLLALAVLFIGGSVADRMFVASIRHQRQRLQSDAILISGTSSAAALPLSGSRSRSSQAFPKSSPSPVSVLPTS